MNIEELAKRKVELSQRLYAIGAANVSGANEEMLINLEIDRIKTQKALNEVEGIIRDFINGKVCQMEKKDEGV